MPEAASRPPLSNLVNSRRNPAASAVSRSGKISGRVHGCGLFPIVSRSTRPLLIAFPRIRRCIFRQVPSFPCFHPTHTRSLVNWSPSRSGRSSSRRCRRCSRWRVSQCLLSHIRRATGFRVSTADAGVGEPGQQRGDHHREKRQPHGISQGLRRTSNQRIDPSPEHRSKAEEQHLPPAEGGAKLES